jgi:hypothetical protein
MFDLVISLYLYYLHINTDKENNFYGSLFLAFAVSVFVAIGFHTRYIDCFYVNISDVIYLKTLLNSYILFTSLVLVDYFLHKNSRKPLLFFK